MHPRSRRSEETNTSGADYRLGLDLQAVPVSRHPERVGTRRRITLGSTSGGTRRRGLLLDGVDPLFRYRCGSATTCRPLVFSRHGGGHPEGARPFSFTDSTGGKHEQRRSPRCAGCSRTGLHAGTETAAPARALELRLREGLRHFGSAGCRRDADGLAHDRSRTARGDFRRQDFDARLGSHVRCGQRRTRSERASLPRFHARRSRELVPEDRRGDPRGRLPPGLRTCPKDLEGARPETSRVGDSGHFRPCGCPRGGGGVATVTRSAIRSALLRLPAKTRIAVGARHTLGNLPGAQVPSLGFGRYPRRLPERADVALARRLRSILTR